MRMKMAAGTRSTHLAFFDEIQRISLVLFSLLLLVRVDAQTDTGDVQTLLQIKAQAGADSSGMAIGYFGTWNESDTTPCGWWGVMCTTIFTVDQLSFAGWQLTTLPNFTLLANLPDLRVLDLSSNDFRDKQKKKIGVTIPEAVGSLAALTSLNLAKNNFSGPIPANISACQSLRYINFQGNSLSEIPDLSAMKNLQYLYLPSNAFTGQFPNWLGKLESLLVIQLSSNMLNGTIPSVSGLPNLVEVMLDGNNFTAFEDPIFPDSTRLEHLDVHDNLLQGPIPPSLTVFKNLRSLDLSINQFSGPIPTNFAIDMSQALSVNFQNNQLNGTIPTNLLQPTEDSVVPPTLVLSFNNLTGPVPMDGTKQYHYTRIDFSRNKLNGSIPVFCNNGSSSIFNFSLNNNQLDGDIVDFLTQSYSCFGNLVLANNSFTGDLSQIAAIVSNSTDLDLITSESTLSSMDLSNNKLEMRVSDVTPDPLRGFLEYFVLNTNVRKLVMSGNSFSGTSLPEGFTSSANNLQALDLSNNGLKGEISGEAFNSTWFPALLQLKLSDNVLTGPIPQATVLIPKLNLLNLTNNRLSGPLPGVLPSQINPNFFAGNGGLCGAPLKACSDGGHIAWWILLIGIGGSLTVAVASCLALSWRWRKYHNLHQQDADLIKTLMERETATLMSLKELKKATSNFSDSAEIGRGGFGTVYVGTLNDGSVVAIKKSKYEGVEKDKNVFLNEVRILSQVSHRHLVKLLGCCMENKSSLLVFEFVPNGTLQEHLQGKIKGKPLSWEQRLSIAIQTADALNYLHTAASFPIYHRDVKSANILLDNELNAKVADFGISRLVPALEDTHVSTAVIQGTIGYMDPEYYTSYQLTDRSDVYSLGVVLLELISARPALDFKRGGEETSLVNFATLHMEKGNMEKVIDASLVETYNDKVGPGKQSMLDVGNLAINCLHTRSKGRPSMREVWKELQRIWMALKGITRELTPAVSLDAKLTVCSDKFREDHIALLGDAYSGSSSGFTLPTVSSIQLSQFSTDSGDFPKSS